MNLILIKLLITNKNCWLCCSMDAESEIEKDQSCSKILKAIGEATYCNALYTKNMAILWILNYNCMHLNIPQTFMAVIPWDGNYRKYVANLYKFFPDFPLLWKKWKKDETMSKCHLKGPVLWLRYVISKISLM